MTPSPGVSMFVTDDSISRRDEATSGSSGSSGSSGGECAEDRVHTCAQVVSANSST